MTDGRYYSGGGRFFVLAISVATIVLLPALVARVDVLDVESP